METRLLRFSTPLKRDEPGVIATIGNFDGVHLGHQSLITATKNHAKIASASSMVITFEPHPVEYFQQKPLPRLTNLREKYHWISQERVDNLLILQFNQRLSELSASAFVKYLRAKIPLKEVIIGEDFRFGMRRLGDVNKLTELGKTYGFGVHVHPPVMLEQKRISSTWVREALKEANFPLVTRLLGHPFMLLGKVRGGDRRGRLLGFPTANIYLQRKTPPLSGVFAVLVHGISSTPLPAVANIGVRPTVDGTRTLLEVHLLNFNQDIYGYQVKVEFCHKLRAEQRYPSLDLLKAQIAIDVDEAGDYFKNRVDYE